MLISPTEPGKRAGDGEGEAHEAMYSRLLGDGRLSGRALDCGDCIGPKARRRAEDVQPRQPGEYVDARGADDRRPDAYDGRVQQSDHVRPACGAGQPPIDRARPGDQLVMERGWDGADIQIAPGRQMA